MTFTAVLLGAIALAVLGMLGLSLSTWGRVANSLADIRNVSVRLDDIVEALHDKIEELE